MGRLRGRGSADRCRAFGPSADPRIRSGAACSLSSLALILLFIVLTAAAADELETAREAVKEGKCAEAIESLDKLIASKPAAEKDRKARELLVKAYARCGSYHRAAAAAAKLALDYPEELSYRALHAEQLVEIGDYEKAKGILDETVKAGSCMRARLLQLELCELLEDDRRARGLRGYFFNIYNADKAKDAETLTAIARAVQTEDANGAWGAYQEAHEADEDYVEAYVEGGFLCLDKSAVALARQEFEKALEKDPGNAVAHTGMAAVCMASSDFGGANEGIEKALGINPNLTLAHGLKAVLLMMEDERADGLQSVRAALSVNSRDLWALSLLAAHHEAAEEPGQRDEAIARVRAVSPSYGRVYATVAEVIEKRRDFPKAVEWARKAVKAAPDDWKGHYLVGINLMRLGEEREGYEALDRSFQINGFNVYAYNVLTVLDEDFKEKKYGHRETEHFHVKMEKKELEIMWPYLEMFLEPAYERLTVKYGMKPGGPKEYGGKILIVVLPDHDKFSARTVGLPGLFALGACFGQVITMPSPRYGRARPSGPFHWRHVLEHEFTHVVTLQKTRYRIPLWLTEGISVMEDTDPHLGLDRTIVWALKNDILYPIEDMNQGFTRPKFPQQVELSYFHASLIVKHLMKLCGEDGMRDVLSKLAEGGDAAKLLPEAAGTDLKTLNESTMDFVKAELSSIAVSVPVDEERVKELEAVEEDKRSADQWAEMASYQLHVDEVEKSRAAAERAIRTDAKCVRAHGILGFIAYKTDKKTSEAKKHFLKAKQLDENYFSARLYLGEIAEEKGASKEAIEEFEAARRIYPRFSQGPQSPYLRLAELYEKAGKSDKAVGVLRDLMKIDDTNLKAQVKLGELLTAQKKPAEAAEAYLSALFIDPYEVETHKALAEACQAAGDKAGAERERRIIEILEK